MLISATTQTALATAYQQFQCHEKTDLEFDRLVLSQKTQVVLAGRWTTCDDAVVGMQQQRGLLAMLRRSVGTVLQ